MCAEMHRASFTAGLLDLGDELVHRRPKVLAVASDPPDALDELRELLQLRCDSKLSHGAKLMYTPGSSTSRTSRNVPEPGISVAHRTNEVHSATNASSAPAFTRQVPLV